MSGQILIIDADVSAAQVTQACLRRVLPQIPVIIVPSIRGVWEQLPQSAPSAIIIDPGTQVVETALCIHYIRQTCPQALVLILASAPTPLLKKTMRDLPVDAYLEKPVAASVLIQALQGLLQRQAERQTLVVASSPVVKR